jgi:predicted dehydrogenase
MTKSESPIAPTAKTARPVRRDFIVAVGGLSLATAMPWQKTSTATNWTMRSKTISGRMRLASVGVGGMGASDLGSLSSHSQVDVVALCDVDSNNLAAASKLHPAAKTFSDYRTMFAEMGSEIDAVNVATPDHTHAAVTLEAMQRDKHVYCQKPLTHDVAEARRVAEVAGERGLVTQMGTQIHSAAPYRTAVKLVQSGAIGKVREVHSWSNKTWGYEGPDPIAAEPPPSLDWDLWIGTAKMRPYAEGQYHPANWRRWCDFGCGTMGDMSIHILDPVFTALQITTPSFALSTSDTAADESFGMQNAVEYEFDGTEFTTDRLRLTWHDGGQMPDTTDWPISLTPDDGQPTLPGQGSMFVGEKGYVLLPHVGNPVLLPESKFANQEVAGGNHYHLWVDAARGGPPTTAHFGYAGPLTEAVLVGVIANRFPKQKMLWDSQTLQFKNQPEANALVGRQYREGFEVDSFKTVTN